ncbi:MAG: hypothetical protein NC417_09120 [Candidatus Gastranaerophilales bacterium]|nr:hypothetical protein [Candidatus Gastranaerophilales bacterium]
MSYTFRLEKNIFMYNHSLVITNGQKHYNAIIESALTKEETMLIWLGDFTPPLDDVDTVKDEITKWFAKQNIKCIFYDGKGR